ncbi:hypothetical protein NKG05_18670 [Oerskovia sp. M15]
MGAGRDTQGGWPTARRPDELRKQVHENLRSLDVEVLDLVNMRMGDAEGPGAARSRRRSGRSQSSSRRG